MRKYYLTVGHLFLQIFNDKGMDSDSKMNLLTDIQKLADTTGDAIIENLPTMEYKNLVMDQLNDGN